MSEAFGRFRDEAEAFGVRLGADQIDQFRTYLHELREWNRTVRLVSRDDPESVIWLHFLDSLTLFPHLSPEGSLLDMGSGAGFPGVPLKIACPGMSLHLAESRRRKAHFLGHIIRTLGLQNAYVHQSRIEEGSSLGRFQVIASRALGPPQTWLPWAIHLMAEEGRIILMLGQRSDVEGVRRLIDPLGLRIAKAVELELPVVKRRRLIVMLEQSGRFT